MTPRRFIIIERTRTGFLIEDRSRGYATDKWTAGTLEGLLDEIDAILREGTELERQAEHPAQDTNDE